MYVLCVYVSVLCVCQCVSMCGMWCVCVECVHVSVLCICGECVCVCVSALCVCVSVRECVCECECVYMKKEDGGRLLMDNLLGKEDNNWFSHLERDLEEESRTHIVRDRCMPTRGGEEKRLEEGAS